MSTFSAFKQKEPADELVWEVNCSLDTAKGNATFSC